jgi:predicted Zn-dependent protease
MPTQTISSVFKRVGDRERRGDAARVRRCLCTVLLFAACQSRANPTQLQPPEVPLVVRLPAGTMLRPVVATSVPDELPWRAAAIWWREALRQTVAFGLDETGNGGVVVELTIDPASKALAAFLKQDGTERALTGGSFAAMPLPAAIDRLAWAVRMALGEEASAPMPVAACTSADPEAVVAVDEAMAMLRTGAVKRANDLLRGARARDGAAPYVLEALASVELMRANLDDAERLCREALAYENRQHPTVQHRLMRTMLLTRASLHPLEAARHDHELLVLGETGHRERPFDWQPQFTRAIAHNFLGDFAKALPLLQTLRVSEPDQAMVAYHLGWACLGTGDAKAAVREFESAATRLPPTWVTVPRAIALYEAGQHGDLEVLLKTLLAEPGADESPVAHDIHRMQAAHALLRGDIDKARQLILLDLNWLAKHPSALEDRAGEFAEQCSVLVRLGGASELPPLLHTIQSQHSNTAIADACAFAGGLVEVAERREPATATEARLSHGGDSVWSALLAAFAHEVRGEVADMQTELSRAARLSASPMTKTLLARGLRAAGKREEADRLQQTLRTEMQAIYLRRRSEHPLLGPELAFAFRAE